MTKIRIGSKIKIISDNENYNPYRNTIWKISHIEDPKKRNKQGLHGAYDMAVYPEKLVSCDGLPFSLYEYEFERV